MQRLLAIVFFFAATGIAAMATENSSLKKLLTADQARMWTGVGRIDMGDEGTCTGALIAPDRVLTAAHCMFNSRTKKPYDPDEITFLTGWRLGRAEAYRRAKRVVIHQGYKDVLYDGQTDRDQVAADLAVIELEHPVDQNAALPFEVINQLRVGSDLTVVSYARGRNDAPSIEERCRLKRKDSRIIIASCDVDFGASGSPIFVMQDGAPRVVSVVSAKGEDLQGKVAIGVVLGRSLDEILSQLNFSGGVFQGKRPGNKSLAEQLGRQ